jgi:L-alanine-DL-glutamate epimerase-like enolase superfamily enzyme
MVNTYADNNIHNNSLLTNISIFIMNSKFVNMKIDRRHFLKTTALGSLAAMIPFKSFSKNKDECFNSELDGILKSPVLKRELFPDPVIIEELQLLRYKDNFICRVRTPDGAEGLSVSNNMQMVSLYPIFVNRLQPCFIGKDARDLESLIEEVYVYKSNYKLQSLALWVPLATIEFAVLDLLGRIAGKPMGELIGEIHNKKMAVYQANNFRGRSAEKSIEGIKKNVEETGAQAVKFKIGGRMSREEKPPGRTEKLVPLVRDAFGEKMTLYADANGAYGVQEAVRIGRILEKYKVDFFEEPVPFDYYEETRQVADNLSIPIAGGEQEPSMHQFKWLIENDALQIVQPDIFYFGGMIRSLKVALMADKLNKKCVPHVSGSGLGYLYLMHYISVLPNSGPYHEFKGFNENIPLQCNTSSLTTRNGIVEIPTGPGSGVDIDPGFIAKHKIVSC